MICDFCKQREATHGEVCSVCDALMQDTMVWCYGRMGELEKKGLIVADEKLAGDAIRQYRNLKQSKFQPNVAMLRATLEQTAGVGQNIDDMITLMLNKSF